MKNIQTSLALFGIVFIGVLPLHSDSKLRLESTFRSSRHDDNPTQNRENSIQRELEQITGLTPTGIGKRIGLVHSLGSDLNTEAVVTLYDFLEKPPGAAENNLAGLHALKNEILNALRSQANQPEDLTDVLAEIYYEKKQDDVTRDYAIQHMVSWFDEYDSSDSREKIRKVLQSAIWKTNSVAGTALLGLHRLSFNHKSISPEEIDQHALSMAQSDKAQIAARITAIQICAERNLQQVLPTVRLLAVTANSVPLRLSSVAALGRLGGPEEAALLHRLRSGNNEALQTAISRALAQLSKNHKLF